MTKKLYGFDFFNSIGSPKHVIAPMVDQSELAWRLLGRKYGAELAYTPMFHAANFVRDPSYRKNSIEISPKDRPLIYQFCANDPDIFTNAAKLVENICDAVDLNLGCPQMIAKRGHYGSYLQEEWDLIYQMLTKCVSETRVPITAKIRAQSSIELTIKYAKMIESTGVSIITIHGRTRDQKGINTGLADWNIIKAVKDSLSIPVFANGNIQYYNDVERCLAVTGADGVMSAEGHLHNPAIFLPGDSPVVWDMANEYLELARIHPCNISCSRGHVFKLLHHALHCHPEIRDLVGSADNVDDLSVAVNRLAAICGPLQCKSDSPMVTELPEPHWVCQPYIRPAARTGLDQKISDSKTGLTGELEHQINVCGVIYQAVDTSELQQRRELDRQKKRTARQICKENKAKKPRSEALPCENCSCNMRGLKCEYKLCRTCCKNKRRTENITCTGHVQWKSSKADADLYVRSDIVI